MASDGGASFALEISASMPEGEKLVSQLDAVSSQLLAAGVSANDMADAVTIASNALADASASSKTANAALSAGASVYADLERAAAQAAKAQEKAARTGVVPPAVAASVVSTSSALEAHVSVLKKLEADAAAAAANEKKLSAALDNTRQVTSHVIAGESSHERQLKKTAGALNSLGGPLGSVGAWAINAADDFGDMSKTMGSTNAVAALVASSVASVVLVAIALAAAAVAATIAIAAWAVGLADTARSAALTQEAVAALDPDIAALSGSFKQIAAETGLAAPELDRLAKSLKDAKVSAADMPDALRAAALAERALGSGGSSDFVAELKKGKRAARDLSAEMSGKLGPIVSKQMQGLDAQSAKLHSNIGSLFGGLNIDPVLSGLKRLVDLFDENTASGAAIKVIFEGVFQPLIDSADKASLFIEAFVLGLEIGVLKAYIALKPTIKAISEFLGFDDTATADTLAMVTKAAEYLVPALAVGAAIFGAFVVAVLAVVGAAVAVQLAIYAMAAAVIYAGVEVVQGVIGAWQSVTSYLDSISLAGVGTAIMQGLANGIVSAAGLPLDAIVGAVGAAITGAKKLLGIHSPSKVFAEIGGYTAEGFAEGVDDGAPDAQAAMTDMVATPMQTTAAAPSGGASSPTSAGKSFDFSGATFTFNGVKDAEHASSLFEEMLTRFFEGTADSISGPEASAT